MTYNEFLKELGKNEADEGPMLRIKGRCPITQVAWQMHERHFGTMQWIIADAFIGLPYKHAYEVVRAADGDGDDTIRKDLEEALKGNVGDRP